MEERIREINSRYEKDIALFKKGRDIKLELLRIGINNDALFVHGSGAVLIQGVTSKSELKQILLSLEDKFASNYLKGDKLYDGCSIAPKKGYDNKISTFKVKIEKATSPFYGGVKLHVTCRFCSTYHDVNINLDDVENLTTKTYAEIDTRSKMRCGEQAYNKSTIESNLFDIDSSRLQIYSSTTPNVSQYVIWFNKRIDIDSLIENI